MKWTKLGLAWRPSGENSWAREYAHLPTPESLDGRTVRVYVATLDSQKYGRIVAVDVDGRNPSRVLSVSKAPLLDLGELGSFDDCGVVPSCAGRIGGRRALYYIGFQRTERVPYMLFTGVATFRVETETWERFYRTPILDRTPEEPYSRAAPWVICQPHEEYHMWYWSCISWTIRNSKVHYNNVLRHAVSADGLNWRVDPKSCLEPDRPDEYSLGRPTVVIDEGLYRMWFSARSHLLGYRIGYAESRNGIDWIRKDEKVGLDRSESGWDSEMICYPAVIDVCGQRLMFYNGNRHGATGFGVAVFEG